MFENAFFKKFPQQPSSFVNDDGDEVVYEFPSLYEGGRGMMGMYTCSWSKARALLPSCSLIPAPGGIGRALVVVGAFEYLNPKGMGPYNELLFGLPTLSLRKNPVGLSMQQLIVDVPENIQRGKHLWGMNKSMGEFEFGDDGDFRYCEVSRNGRRVLRFEVPRKGRSRRFEDCMTLVTQKDGQLLRSRSCMSGRRLDTRKGASLLFGADPFAAELQGLEISDSPLKASFISPLDNALSLPLEAEAI